MTSYLKISKMCLACDWDIIRRESLQPGFGVKFEPAGQFEEAFSDQLWWVGRRNTFPAYLTDYQIAVSVIQDRDAYRASRQRREPPDRPYR